MMNNNQKITAKRTYDVNIYQEDFDPDAEHGWCITIYEVSRAGATQTHIEAYVGTGLADDLPLFTRPDDPDDWWDSENVPGWAEEWVRNQIARFERATISN